MKPFLNIKFNIPDGEAHVMPDGKVYIYGSLDTKEDSWCSNQYKVISSADLEQWVESEISFSIKDVPWADEIQEPAYLDNVKSYNELPEAILTFLPEETREMPIDQFLPILRNILIEQQKNKSLFAPDCIYKDGKYYLYFCLSDDTEGVAVSDSPTGPFKNAVKLPVKGIDPAVFVDDDGQAYYYWGQFSSCGAKLNPDMMSIDESTIVERLVTEKEHHFHEGSSMRKRGDTYYYVFADISSGRPSSLGYATSKSPLGPFTYQGVIVDNISLNEESWNNHGSIEEVNGQWYVFFHVSTNGQYLRRACMAPIEFDENGLIKKVDLENE